METTFSIFETVAEVKFSFVLNVGFSGTEVTLLEFSGVFFEAEVVSIEQIAVLVVFREKKCRFKSVLRFAVVELKKLMRRFLS